MKEVHQTPVQARKKLEHARPGRREMILQAVWKRGGMVAGKKVVAGVPVWGVAEEA